jgi:hypothetical protein
MQDSHAPLSIWFWGAYLVGTQTPGAAGLSRYAVPPTYEARYSVNLAINLISMVYTS